MRKLKVFLNLLKTKFKTILISMVAIGAVAGSAAILVSTLDNNGSNNGGTTDPIVDVDDNTLAPRPTALTITNENMWKICYYDSGSGGTIYFALWRNGNRYDDFGFRYGDRGYYCFQTGMQEMLEDIRACYSGSSTPYQLDLSEMFDDEFLELYAPLTLYGNVKIVGRIQGTGSQSSIFTSNENGRTIEFNCPMYSPKVEYIYSTSAAVNVIFTYDEDQGEESNINKLFKCTTSSGYKSTLTLSGMNYIDNHARYLNSSFIYGEYLDVYIDSGDFDVTFDDSKQLTTDAIYIKYGSFNIKRGVIRGTINSGKALIHLYDSKFSMSGGLIYSFGASNVVYSESSNSSSTLFSMDITGGRIMTGSSGSTTYYAIKNATNSCITIDSLSSSSTSPVICSYGEHLALSNPTSPSVATWRSTYTGGGISQWLGAEGYTTVKLLRGHIITTNRAIWNDYNSTIEIGTNGFVKSTNNSCIYLAYSGDLISSGTIDGSSSIPNSPIDVVGDGNTLTFNGGTVNAGTTGNAAVCITYDAENTVVNFNSGNMNSKCSYGTIRILNASSTVTISGGTINNTSGCSIYNESASKVTIIGGTIYGIHNDSNGTINIDGGTIYGSSENDYGIYNRSSGSINVTGGTISSGDAGIALNGTGSTTTISGGYIWGYTSLGVYGSNNIVNISGGTLQGEGYTIYNNSNSTINISGNAIIYDTDDEDDAIRNYAGTINIKGGSVWGIMNYSTGTINVSGGIVMNEESHSYSIINYSTGTINVTGGLIEYNDFEGHEEGRAIYNYARGYIKISGGYIDSDKIGIYLRDGEYDGDSYLNTIGGEIEAYTYGIYNYGEATISLTNIVINSDYCGVYLYRGAYLLVNIGTEIYGHDYGISNDGYDSGIYIRDGAEVSAENMGIYCHTNCDVYVYGTIKSNGYGVYFTDDGYNAYLYVGTTGYIRASNIAVRGHNECDITVNSYGQIFGEEYGIVAYYSEINIFGGLVKSDGTAIDVSDNTRLNITNATVNGYNCGIYVSYNSITKITNGDIYSNEGVAIYVDDAQVTIDGANSVISGSGGCLIQAEYDSTIIIKAGVLSFYSETGSAIEIYESSLEMTGGTIDSDADGITSLGYASIDIRGGTINVDGTGICFDDDNSDDSWLFFEGTINAHDGITCYGAGYVDVHVHGGEINVTNVGINVSGRLVYQNLIMTSSNFGITLWDDNNTSTIEINSGMIVGNNAAIDISYQSNSTLMITGGIIKGANNTGNYGTTKFDIKTDARVNFAKSIPATEVYRIRWINNITSSSKFIVVQNTASIANASASFILSANNATDCGSLLQYESTKYNVYIYQRYLSSIAASYDYSKVKPVYYNTTLDTLKNGLTVTATYAAGTTEVLSASQYSLSTVSGLQAPSTTVTVSATLGTTKTTTFSTTVETGTFAIGISIPSSVTYGTDPVVTVTNNISGGAVSYEHKTATGSWTTGLPRSVGTYYIKAIVAATPYYEKSEAISSTTITVNALNLSSAAISLSGTYKYTGSAQTPKPTLSVTIYGSSVTLVENTDYTLTYTNNTNAGTATVTATGKGNYTGTKSINFTIDKANISLTITSIPSSVIYGTDPTIVISGNSGGGAVTYGHSTTTTIASANGLPRSVGSFYIKVFVAETTNYNAGTVTSGLISVTAFNLSNATMTISPTSYTYTGNACQPTPTVTANIYGVSTTLGKDTDYTVGYSNNTNAGTGTATVTAKSSNFTGTNSKTFTINKADITLTITFTPASVIYGTDPSITLGGNSGNGTVTYEHSTSATGPWTTGLPRSVGSFYIRASVPETTNYNAGSVVSGTKLTVTAFNLSNATMTISPTSYTYTGSALTPTVTLKATLYGTETTLLKDTDYTITYENNTNAGTGTVTVTAKSSNFTGTNSKTFTISKANLNLIITSMPSSVIYGTDPTIVISGNSGGGAVTYGHNTTTTIASANGLPRSVGTFYIKVFVAETANYLAGTVTSGLITVNAYNLAAVTMSITPTSYTYTGNAYQPTITLSAEIYGETKTLVSGTDYTPTYDNNINAGIATAIATGKGNYTGTNSEDFTINKADIALTISFAPATVIYGTDPSITLGGNSGNGTVTYYHSTSATGPWTEGLPRSIGTFYIKASVEETNNYKAGNVVTTGTLKVTQYDLANATVLLSKTTYTYSGSACTPTITVKATLYGEETVLIEGTHYNKAYLNNTLAGTASATVTAIDSNYKLSKTVNFTIAKAELDLGLVASDVVYGTDITPILTGNSGSGTVTYSYSTALNGTYTAGLPRLAGDFYIKATVGATANYNGKEVITEDKVNVAQYDLVNAKVTLNPNGYTYSGSACTPTVTVIVTLYGSETTLTKEVHYDVVYAKNTAAGIASATIDALDANYKESKTVEFTIAKADLNLTLVASNVVYGTDIAPELSGNSGNGAVTYSYSTTIDGTYTNGLPRLVGSFYIKATVAATTNHNGGTAITSKAIVVSAFDITKAAWTLSQTVYTYDGQAKTPTITGTATIYGELVTLEVPADYTYEYKNNTKAGTAKVDLTGAGNFTGQHTVEYTINKADLDLGLTVNNVIYGTDLSPVLTGNIELGTVTYSYSTSINGVYTAGLPRKAGNFYIKASVAETTNYKADAITTLNTVEIAEYDLANATITLSQYTYSHTRSEIKPNVVVEATLYGVTTKLQEGTDYSLAYLNNINAGTATAKITAIDNGNFTNELSSNYTITAIKIVENMITTIGVQKYTGKDLEPNVEIKFGNYTLVLDTDYTYSYKNNKDLGTATIEIIGLNNYTTEEYTDSKLVISFTIEQGDLNLNDLPSLVNLEEYVGTKLTEVNKDAYENSLGQWVFWDYTNNSAYDPSTTVGPANASGNLFGVKFIPYDSGFKEIAASYYKATIIVIRKETMLSITNNISKTYDKTEVSNPLYTTNSDANPETEVVIDYYKGSSKLSYVPLNAGEYTVRVTVLQTDMYKTKYVEANFSIATKNINDLGLNDIAPIEFTTQAITPDVELYFGDYRLIKGTDYDLSYTPNINLDEVTITITAKGNYSNTRTIEFEIIQCTIIKDMIYPIDSQIYKGVALTPDITIFNHETRLEKDVDYTVVFKFNDRAGMAEATITGINDYTGTVKVNFAIVSPSIPSEQLPEVNPIIAYVGDKLSNITLPHNEAGEWIFWNNAKDEAYDSNATVGEANPLGNKFSIRFIPKDSSYASVDSVIYIIVNKKAVEIIVSNEEMLSKTYDGKELNNLILTTNLGNGFTFDIKYYQNGTEINKPINAGTYLIKVSVEGTNATFASSLEIYVTISPKEITDQMVENILDQIYTEEQIKPIVLITDGDETLTINKDYKVYYGGNTALNSTGYVYIFGNGNYTGEVTKTFTIIKNLPITTPDDKEVIVGTVEDQVYTGNELEPSVVITYGDETLVLGIDYEFDDYKNNINVGKASFNVVFMGRFDGVAMVMFNITAVTLTNENTEITFNPEKYTYTGHAIQPTFTVTVNGQPITSFKKTLSNNIEIGEALLTITGTGNYNGTVNAKFNIIAPKATVLTINTEINNFYQFTTANGYTRVANNHTSYDSNVEIFLVNVSHGQKIIPMLSQFTNDISDIRIFDNTGAEVLSSTWTKATVFIGTGWKINLYDNGNLIDSITVVVTGDVNGDGAIRAADRTLTSNFISGSTTAAVMSLTTAQILAMDLDINGAIRSADTLKYTNYFNGKATLNDMYLVV